ncbi:MAG: hypothetical protein VCC00_07105 [Deltaproteobacteria bacterium]
MKQVKSADKEQRPRLPWYKNTLLVTGLFLMVMGLGNWITGETRTSRHQEEAFGLGQPHAAQPLSSEKIAIARSRMDFYHVVATGGRGLTALGLLLTTFGLARHLRRRAKER